MGNRTILLIIVSLLIIIGAIFVGEINIVGVLLFILFMAAIIFAE